MGRWAIAAAAGTLVLAACSGMGASVRAEAVDGADRVAASYHTYAWLPEPASADRNHDPSLQLGIRQIVDRELRAHGYELLELGTPDFLVGSHLVLGEPTDAESLDAYYGYGFAAVPAGAGGSGAGESLGELERGTVMLDVVDWSGDRLLWRGAAQVRLGSDLSSAATEARIEAALARILLRFPPRR